MTLMHAALLAAGLYTTADLRKGLGPAAGTDHTPTVRGLDGKRHKLSRRAVSSRERAVAAGLIKPVERVLIEWMKGAEILAKYDELSRSQIEAAERAALSRLKAKYEGTGV